MTDAKVWKFTFGWSGHKINKGNPVHTVMKSTISSTPATMSNAALQSKRSCSWKKAYPGHRDCFVFFGSVEDCAPGKRPAPISRNDDDFFLVFPKTGTGPRTPLQPRPSSKQNTIVPPDPSISPSLQWVTLSDNDSQRQQELICPKLQPRYYFYDRSVIFGSPVSSLDDIAQSSSSPQARPPLKIESKLFLPEFWGNPLHVRDFPLFGSCLFRGRGSHSLDY